jgi:hypothetical protein
MPFNRDEVDALLTAGHRRCSICHRFCGVKIETDHIEQAADCGPDDIKNAIPVCLEAYVAIGRANQHISPVMFHEPGGTLAAIQIELQNQ